MATFRTIAETITLKETLEGAGVRLHRGFGYPEVPRFDPFLLFDDFSSSHIEDYASGFPFHPHRGIETVTYVRKGDVHHRDSMHNEGYIRAGDVQWMTAGSGVVHEEMPEGDEGLTGFQLWVNLPQSHKMMAPRYQEISHEQIPHIEENGARIAVIAGEYKGTRGPVENIIANPVYLDVTLAPHTPLTIPVSDGDTAFIYVVQGSLEIENETRIIPQGTIVRFEKEGDTIVAKSGESEVGFLYVSGKPIGEPITWYGPIVMNTDEEIKTALEELRNGTFIK
jgi:quercetin 2,3-dioxygenase